MVGCLVARGHLVGLLETLSGGRVSGAFRPAEEGAAAHELGAEPA